MDTLTNEQWQTIRRCADEIHDWCCESQGWAPEVADGMIGAMLGKIRDSLGVKGECNPQFWGVSLVGIIGDDEMPWPVAEGKAR